jgi:adenylate kinase
VASRRHCAGCGLDQGPGDQERCDACGGKLVTRDDDTPEALATRVRDYHEKTRPIIELFERKEFVAHVDATRTVDEVQREIREKLGLPQR